MCAVTYLYMYLWHSNTDKIGKLKYMIKLESDIWSNSNMWSKLLLIYGQSQIYGQIHMINLKYIVKRKLWSFCPYMVKHAANIWSKFKNIPLHNGHRYDVLLVNWTDVTSTESQPESAFANKIRDRAHKRTLMILTLCSHVHGPAPFRAESGDLTISLRSYVGGLVRETGYVYNQTLYGKHEWNY